jgi:phosphatidylinositol kinase/protein kinase (PI-3  family)
MRTYALVPLGKSSGLIEWVRNTDTLKTVIQSEWKLSNIKGDMTEIKDKATKKGHDTHSGIWNDLKNEI